MDAKNILSVSLILFSVIDIIGSLPIIIDLKEKGNRIESAKAAAVSLVLMVTFLYVGDQVYDKRIGHRNISRCFIAIS